MSSKLNQTFITPKKAIKYSVTLYYLITKIFLQSKFSKIIILSIHFLAYSNFKNANLICFKEDKV